MSSLRLVDLRVGLLQQVDDVGVVQELVEEVDLGVSQLHRICEDFYVELVLALAGESIDPPERAARLRARLGLTDERPLEFLPGRTSPEPAPAPKMRYKRLTTSVAKPATKKPKPAKKAKKSKKKRFENVDYSKQYTTKRRRTETTAASP